MSKTGTIALKFKNLSAKNNSFSRLVNIAKLKIKYIKKVYNAEYTINATILDYFIIREKNQVIQKCGLKRYSFTRSA